MGSLVPGGGGGGLNSQYTWQGGPTSFGGVEIYTLGILLSQEICHVFFFV